MCTLFDFALQFTKILNLDVGIMKLIPIEEGVDDIADVDNTTVEDNDVVGTFTDKLTQLVELTVF